MTSAVPWSHGDGMVHVYDALRGPQSIVPGTVLVTVMLGRKKAVLTRRDDHSCVFTAPAYELDPDIEYEVINDGGARGRRGARSRTLGCSRRTHLPPPADERYARARAIAESKKTKDAESQQDATSAKKQRKRR